MRARQAGFTLIELLVVVVLIALLAVVAVPAFFSETRRVKGDSEVGPFFAELQIREEQYLGENGIYLSTGASETTTFPAAPSSTAQPLGLLPVAWLALKVRPPESEVRCGYVVVTGTPADAAGPMATSFGFVAPSVDWYYMLAHCDLDGDGSVDSYYFASSIDQSIRKINYGR